jgi:outer membrane protein OmpA-like peptidoglycan-associated protein
MTANKNNGYWISIADLMSGLMIIFVFIALAYMHEIKDIMNGVIYITEGFKDDERSLYNELHKEFKNDLEDWNATIDAKTLSIIFKEPDVLFKKGEFSIKKRFKIILNDFFPRYVTVLNSKQFRSNILAIRIEGHTSSEWSRNTPEREAYLNNMSLSQLRASEVLNYVLSTFLNGSYVWVRNRLQAVGYSSSKVKLVKSGIEDKNLSRRVEFKVVTNTKDQLYEVVSIIEKGRQS